MDAKILPNEIKSAIAGILSLHTGMPVAIIEAFPVGGGCINHSCRVVTSAGPFFIKFNDASRYPGMFEAEARGLNLLKQHAEANATAKAEHKPTLRVPAVIGCHSEGRNSMLVLEYLETGKMHGNFWELFGRGLAGLHLNTNKNFGLDHSNYIGSLPQSNKVNSSWTEFFITERLEAQLKLARDNGKADRSLGKKFHEFYRYLPDLFPDEPPALLHGDLWSGNYMVGPEGESVIIDPAVYYGHRYMDIGMSKLFGGFSATFYEAYQQVFPFEKNWHEGIEAANLYPLMVHVNLFGGGYLGQVNTILRRYCR